MTAPAFGVYVHWPFCAAKCPYCDFNSHVRHAAPPEERFARAIVSELESFAAMTERRQVTSIFFGGGTPSLMAPATVAAVLDAIGGLWPVATDVEVTLEANPSSVEASRFAGYRAAGVNRLSLGVQSLDDRELKFLGRLHDAAAARRAIALAAATFPRFSFDLIYARPGQGLDDWRAELGAALDLAGEHLSLYQLTIEEGTPFAALHARGRMPVPEEGLAADLFELTQEMTERAGLPAYEISNHARPGAECRHNLVYWRGEPYVGAGAGAHGRLVADGAWRATATERSPERWLAAVEAHGHGLVVDAPVDPAERAEEMLFMGLRLAEGVDAERLAALAERPLDARRVADLTEEGLLEHGPGPMLRATARGRLVLDSLIAAIAA